MPGSASCEDPWPQEGLTMTTSELEHRVSSADLISALAARAPETGGNDGGWPGLTLYRFTEPTAPAWEEIQSLSLGIVAQGSKAVIVDGRRYVYDPFHYLVISSNLHFQAEVLQAGPASRSCPSCWRSTRRWCGRSPSTCSVRGQARSMRSRSRARPTGASSLRSIRSSWRRSCGSWARSAAGPIDGYWRRCASRRWSTGY